MTGIVWDEVGTKYYEDGLDHGVLYVAGTGVPWNGLTSVDHGVRNDVSPIYIDGYKTLNLITYGDFEASLKAYTYPDEFLPCLGILRSEGLFVDNQSLMEFGLAYRTSIANDVTKTAGYKIHLLYNLTAIADTQSYKTLSLEASPIEFSWTLHSRQEETGFRPTSHVIVDSRFWDPVRLKAFEEILFGTPLSPPTLPSIEELSAITNPDNELVILDHGDGSWSAVDLTDRYIYPYTNELYEIDAPTVALIDANTFDVSTYGF